MRGNKIIYTGFNMRGQTVHLDTHWRWLFGSFGVLHMVGFVVCFTFPLVYNPVWGAPLPEWANSFVVTSAASGMIAFPFFLIIGVGLPLSLHLDAGGKW